ncbi:MAG: hypothetical protein ABI261_08725 [Ginsengibacter sp.]
MKKLIIILIAAVSFNAASAQSWDNSNRKQDRKQITNTGDTRNYNDQSYSKDYAYNNNNGQKYDRKFQADYDRINHQYDQRIYGYRNDRSINTIERDRRIRAAEMERQQSLKSFGGGAIVGGVAGFLLGVLVSH